MALVTIKKGDSITFKAATRDGKKKATRIVSDTYDTGVTVNSYVGRPNFFVRFYEIQEVNGEEYGYDWGIKGR